MGKSSSQAKKSPTIRQSVTFPQEQHQAIEMLARNNNVSIGWIIRLACEKLLEDCDKQKLFPNMYITNIEGVSNSEES